MLFLSKLLGVLRGQPGRLPRTTGGCGPQFEKQCFEGVLLCFINNDILIVTPVVGLYTALYLVVVCISFTLPCFKKRPGAI
jgi:hypothetical protein